MCVVFGGGMGGQRVDSTHPGASFRITDGCVTRVTRVRYSMKLGCGVERD